MKDKPVLTVEKASEYMNTAFKNEEKIKEANYCGCYHCCSILEKDTLDWHIERHGEKTAMCPKCGIDSIVDNKTVTELGNRLDIPFLKALNKLAF